MQHNKISAGNSWSFTRKSIGEIFEKNAHVRNIRKKLVKAKIEKQMQQHFKKLH
ncbi:MAG: hypothetical protein JW891_07800 [Candidatus Lokiarchaeota archaeon]|nr:hypothetical protein [Candidatus Lokiarchaeota archaeon]